MDINNRIIELAKNNFNYSEVHLEHIPQNYYIFGDKKWK
jgi:hypothetical protein